MNIGFIEIAKMLQGSDGSHVSHQNPDREGYVSLAGGPVVGRNLDASSC
jgi:hypothetical protein